MTVPDDVDALFDLPGGEFVAARDEVVTRLKGEGEAARAATVKALRRPTLAAWAVNQVVRADADAYEALVAAGRTVQKAQRRALSGLRDSGLRDASTARRGLVEALTDHAARVLDRAGARPESHLDDVVATFEAASSDPDAAATIGQGRLSAPVRVTTDFSGTSALLAMSLAATDEGADPDEADAVDPVLAEQRREAIRALEAACSRAAASAASAQAAREQVRTLADEADDARRAADEARAAAERAEATAHDVAEQARAAEEAATTVTADAAADATAVAEAQDLLDGLG